MKERCLVIPALKKHAVIPDQLVKKLAGETLIARAIATARSVCQGQDIHVVTDSQEIGLICERSGVSSLINPAMRFKSRDIVSEMQSILAELARDYAYAIILRASCPLLTWIDVENAWKAFHQAKADLLVTVKKVHQRLWNLKNGTLEHFFDDRDRPLVLESRALIILRLGLQSTKGAVIRPYFLDEQAIEIEGYQDWWICERLLMRRHIVFVVAGYPAIGMGHVFRALMLAHEITNHKITFVATQESELAVENIAQRDYKVIREQDCDLAKTVLSLHPDLVVNDFLNTPGDYMEELRTHGVHAVNFEDDGEGADKADLVINALYEESHDDPRYCFGPGFFCLRDEFLQARRNPLRDSVGTLLITFGGTDPTNCTRRVLDIVEPICRAYGIRIRIVSGPGYAHKESLEQHIKELENPRVTFTHATNIMSRMMEGADLAICSAGRTVYELCHMRIPALVIAHHEREARHTFARPRNGFAFVGLMQRVSDTRIRNVFLAMLKQDRRARFWKRQDALDFTGNKAGVIRRIEEILER